MSFFEELKRRNVIRVGIAYVIVAWLVMQFADVVLNNIQAPGWVFQVIMLVLGIGFPVVMIFAWAFEMTPEGIKKEKDVDCSKSVTKQTGRKLDRMIIGVMAAVIAFLVIDRFVLNDGASAPVQTAENSTEAIAAAAPVKQVGPSVAVLPFVNMSGDKENEYFSDGLTETLLHMLAQLPNLRVAARTSSFAFKGQNKSIDEIASALGVAHILEGSVQKSGNRIRVTAQLVRADDGFHVWSQNYTRPLEDIFAIQDEIAEDVASALDASLLGGTTRAMRGVETSNLTAYESYLKGLEQQAIYSYGSLSIAENHFKQALARDPKFTDARLALVRNYLLKHNTGLIKDQEARELVEPLIQQVLAQQADNRLAHALELVANIQLNGQARSREELEPLVSELRNLLPLVPTETIARVVVAAVLNFFFNEGQSAIEVLEAGLMVDPLDANLHRNLGNIYKDLERNDDALAAYQKAQQLAPDNPNTYSSLAALEAENNNLLAALEWHRRATEVDPQDHELAAAIANILFKLELPEEGDQWYARVTALAPGSPVAKHTELHRYLARKETQKALELATSMVSEQIENRRGAFGEAVFLRQRIMMNAGKSKQAYDFLVSVRPEIINYDEKPTDLKGWLMQGSSISLMSGFASPDTRKEAWLKMTANMDKAGFPWREPDQIEYFLDKVYTGDIDGAIDVFLEHRLSRPLATDLEMYFPTSKVPLAEVYADPRVIARMAELGKEYEQLRVQVRDLMLEPEWNQ